MKSNEQLLNEAVRRGDLKEARLLVALGVEPNWQDKDGLSPLHHAAAWEDTSFIELMLEQPRIKIELPDDTGATALHHAARHGRAANISKLAAKGADIEARDSWLTTPLMTAAHGGHEEALEQLLKLKASIVAEDAMGRGALHYAVVRDNLPATKILLRAGADPRVADFNGVTPAALAQKAPHRAALSAAMAKYYFRYGTGTELAAPPRAQFRKKPPQP